jgi:hypothetical protein
MKKIIFLTLFLLFSTTIIAQNEEVPVEDWLNTEYSNPYLKDINNVLNKFEGEWLYTDATHYFKIKFYKIEHVDLTIMGGHWIFDELRSFMLYKELQGGVWVTVYNTYPASYTPADLQNSAFNNFTSIHGNAVYKNNLNKIGLFHYEPAPPCSRVNKRSNNVLYSTVGGQETLTWTLDYYYTSNVVKPCPDSVVNNPQYNYKIPENMVMVKL